MDRPDVSLYVNSPDLLIAICKEVINELDSRRPKDDYAQLYKQLRETKRTINKLEKIGIVVSDNLIKRRHTLLEDLEGYREVNQPLEDLATSLKEMSRDIYKRLGWKGKQEAMKMTSKIETKAPTPNEVKTSSIILRQQILQALITLGGAGTTHEVFGVMARSMNGNLSPGDLDVTEDSELTWQSNARWERFCMVQEGLLKNDSSIGIWQLSE